MRDVTSAALRPALKELHELQARLASLPVLDDAREMEAWELDQLQLSSLLAKQAAATTALVWAPTTNATNTAAVPAAAAAAVSAAAASGRSDYLASAMPLSKRRRTTALDGTSPAEELDRITDRDRRALKSLCVDVRAWLERLVRYAKAYRSHAQETGAGSAPRCRGGGPRSRQRVCVAPFPPPPACLWPHAAGSTCPRTRSCRCTRSFTVTAACCCAAH